MTKRRLRCPVGVDASVQEADCKSVQPRGAAFLQQRHVSLVVTVELLAGHFGREQEELDKVLLIVDAAREIQLAFVQQPIQGIDDSLTTTASGTGKYLRRSAKAKKVPLFLSLKITFPVFSHLYFRQVDRRQLFPDKVFNGPIEDDVFSAGAVGEEHQGHFLMLQGGGYVQRGPTSVHVLPVEGSRGRPYGQETGTGLTNS